MNSTMRGILMNATITKYDRDNSKVFDISFDAVPTFKIDN